MTNKIDKWLRYIEALKNMVQQNGEGDRSQIRTFLEKLNTQDLWEIEAFVYFGEYGIDYLDEIIEKKVDELGRESKDDVISNICSKSLNIKRRMENAEIIIHG